MLPIEFGWTPQLFGYEGAYRVGFMFDTGGMPEITTDVNGEQLDTTGVTARRSGESYNAFVALNQRISGTNGGAGWCVGLRAVAGDRKTSVLDRQITATLEYDNPFQRVGGRFGIGFAATHTSSREAEYQLAWNAAHPDGRCKRRRPQLRIHDGNLLRVQADVIDHATRPAIRAASGRHVGEQQCVRRGTQNFGDVLSATHDSTSGTPQQEKHGSQKGTFHARDTNHRLRAAGERSRSRRERASRGVPAKPASRISPSSPTACNGSRLPSLTRSARWPNA
ncbi:MAG: hypothetical protein CPDRYMAC_4782 [uncultured Paraburkholderia sp.]|nr:MAG: hypothetical protein CPDRYDRY_4695 [uncultured Paraburkholderia sp.]CAH2938099.1 MAG: hypothetical protein CPDRYMAC_4782 [uncultured Paraburkholderia sp.]